MRIGISILTRPGQSVWQNGIGQNVFFLAECLSSIPFVERIFLIDCGSAARLPEDAAPYADRFPIVSMADAPDDLDLVIEMEGGLDVEWLRRLRARGGRVVLHICGQPYAALVEPTTFERPGFFSEATRCDEVWVLPKDRKFMGMLRAIHRCPVFETPYLWSPDLLEERIAEVRQHGLDFGYREGSLAQDVRIAIFEPNISVIKMGIVPFLIAESLEREDAGIIAQVHLLNARAFEGHRTFSMMRENAHLQRNGKLSLHERHKIAPFMANSANLVISHQIDCPQNYLYFDVLYGGYPLIHNSDMFASVGYHYSNSDIGAGAQAVRRAIRFHDEQLVDYRKAAHSFINLHHPARCENVAAYSRRILSLFRNLPVARPTAPKMLELV